MLDSVLYWTGAIVWTGGITWLSIALLYPLAASLSWHALCVLRAIRTGGWRTARWHLLPKSVLVVWWDYLRTGVPDTMRSTHITWRGVFKWETSFPVSK